MIDKQLAELARLHQEGALTDGEFKAAKARVLGEPSRPDSQSEHQLHLQKVNLNKALRLAIWGGVGALVFMMASPFLWFWAVSLLSP